MASIVQIADFKGEINITQSKFSTTDIQDFIDRYEELVLKDLLGDDLYLKFKNDGYDSPTRQRYIDLLNGVVYADSNNSDYNVDFKGMKDMLRFFVFYYYLINQPYQNTMIGTVKGVSRNAENPARDIVNSLAFSRYNKGVELYDGVIKFVEHENCRELDITSIVDQTGDVYLVTLPSTKYILDGDTVEINNKDYTVSNLITDTSFEISETSGTVFPSGLKVIFEIFETFQKKEKRKSYFDGVL